MHISRPNGFTFLELIVVMIVAGFLVTAVIIGSTISDSAKVRGIISEVSNYQVSIQTFTDRYKDLPGDISNAENFWGTRCTTDTSECNGNGDREILWDDTVNGDGDTVRESPLAWRHLWLADLFPYELSGVGVNASIGNAPSNNVPVSPHIAIGGWYFHHYSLGNFMRFGAEKTPSLGVNDDPVLSAPMAFEIDKKLDDGEASEGDVRSSGASCLSLGDYTDNEGVVCVMLFHLFASM